jgi:hypothetical protein
MDPEAKQRQILGVLRRIVQQSNARNLAVLLEDLHWLDPSSENFLEHWVEAIAGSCFLLLVTFRPEYRADWMQKSYYRQLRLAPLPPEAIRELLADLLGDDPSTGALADAIHERTAGNPFYAEELVQMLIESAHLTGSRGSYRLLTPIERLEVPASVQAVLAARIDRLPEREKHVLQAAAVIGREFAEPLLLAAAGIPAVELREALAALETGEFVHEEALYPVAEYAFKHALTQAVALGSQLRERRRRTHASVARAIEARGDVDEDAALLAHHWEEAGDALAAARCHHRAADWVGRSNTAEAMRHWRLVLALTDPLEASDERDELRLVACGNVIRQGGWRFGISREELDALFAEGKALATRAGRVDEALALHTGYGVTVGFSGELRRYHEVAREARALADESASLGARAFALVDMCFSSYLLGHLRDALVFAEEIPHLVQGDLDVGIDFGGFGVMIWSCFERSHLCALLGRLDEARVLHQQTFDRGRQEDAQILAAPFGRSGEIVDWSGEAKGSPLLTEARRHAVRSIETSERAGNHFLRSWGYRGLAVTQILNGDWRDALETLEAVLAMARERRVGLEHEAQHLALQSRAWLGAGDTARARAKAEQSVALAREQGALFFECLAQVTLARALGADARAGAADEIEACLARAHALVSETGGRVLEPQIGEERARLAELRGNREAATALLKCAHALYVEIGAAGHAERLARELDR